MKTVNIREAKARLSKLVAEAEAGGEVIIARAGRPAARIVPLGGPAPERRFGSMKGRAVTGAAFFDPLPEDERAAWE